MYYRVTILKGKPEMAEKGYALLDENRAKLEAMPGIEHIRLFEADDDTSVVIACYESQKACKAVTVIANEILGSMREMMTAPPAKHMGEVTWEL